MKLSTREEKGVSILEVRGNIMGGPDDNIFYDKLKELLGQGKKKIVLDLSKVEWINSRGLGILISGLTTTRKQGGELKLASAAEKVKSLLTLTRLITAFESHDTVKAAIESFT